MIPSPGHFEVHYSGPSGEALNARLEWVEGVPVLTNLGPGAGQVRVNAVPLATAVPYFIQPGDRISLGEITFTWSTELETPRPIQMAAQPSAPKPTPPKPVLAAPRAISLEVRTTQGAKEFPLTGEIIRLGRAVDNDISIDDKMVSRYHAQLLRKGETYEIVDLGSVNGLTYQHTRFTKRLLADGDVIGISRTITLTFHGLPQQTAAPEAAELGTMVAPPKSAAPSPPPFASEEQAPPETIVAAPKAASEPTPPPAIPEEQAAPKTIVSPAKVVAKPTPSPAVPEEQAAPETIVAPRKMTAIPTPSAAVPEEQAAPETIVSPRRVTAKPTPPAAVPEEQVAPETIIGPSKASAAPAPTPAEPAAPETMVTAPKVEPTPSADLAETAAVDMASLVASGFDQQFIPALKPRDTQVPYLIVHMPERTWDVDLTSEHLTIGRSEDSTIRIQDDSISRFHASIERRGEGFVIRDQQSRNGVWLGRQRIDQHRLRDGDVISIGRAKLIFKGGFRQDDLTLIGSPRIDGKPARRPVVFVPGFGGSELWLGSEKIWPVPKIMISNPEILRLPGDPRVEARGIVSDVVIIPGIMKQQQYSRMGDYLESGLGYKRGRDLFEFAYDWRQDIRINSQRLGQAIDAWGIRSPITIIAHSLGTLVSRYYVEKYGGKDKVERLVLMGGPHYGTPRGLAIITVGPGTLPFGFGDERMRKVLNTMTSSYQILPIYPCVFDQHDRHIDLLEDESWLPEDQRHFLGTARIFRQELGFQSSVPAVSVFGYGLKTVLRVKVIRRPDGSWQKIEPIDELGGDLTIPAGSSVLQNSEIHPVLQEHGSLYVDDDVKMRLKVELTRSTTLQRRK